MWGGCGMRWWCERCEEAWLCSLGADEPWPRLRLPRVEYSDSLPLPERESAPPPSPTPEGDFSPPPTVLPGPLLPRRRSPSLLVEPLLRLPEEQDTENSSISFSLSQQRILSSTQRRNSTLADENPSVKTSADVHRDRPSFRLHIRNRCPHKTHRV